jgi:ParB-like chromosome segregation protein Spo0J
MAKPKPKSNGANGKHVNGATTPKKIVNLLKLATSPAPAKQPLARVLWIDPKLLHSNDYNPNKVFGPELKLLKISLLQSGWTQPIVAQADGEIVDGFHRWSLGMNDKDVRALTGGLVPVVVLNETDRAEQMMATIRHNRARGKHSVLHMASITQALHKEHGMEEQEIEALLGMEEEEVERLMDVRGSPEAAGADAFGKGWVPDKV